MSYKETEGRAPGDPAGKLAEGETKADDALVEMNVADWFESDPIGESLRHIVWALNNFDTAYLELPNGWALQMDRGGHLLVRHAKTGAITHVVRRTNGDKWLVVQVEDPEEVVKESQGEESVNRGG